MEKEKVKIKYLRDVEPVEKIKAGDWIDLKVAEDIVLNEGEFKLLPLGVAIQLPEGYEAIVAPRSSTFKRYKCLMANSIGIIDESYCGDNDEWCMPIYATKYAIIPKNTRICQFRIVPHQPDFDIVTVESLGNSDRGGFGSTGV